MSAEPVADEKASEPIQEPKVAETASKRPINANCEVYRGLVSQYDWDTDLMLAIMRAESGCNPMAINGADNHRVCLGSYGLFQIGCVHFKGEDMHDPETNIRLAYRIYKSQGLNAWGAFSNLSYLRFM